MSLFFLQSFRYMLFARNLREITRGLKAKWYQGNRRLKQPKHCSAISLKSTKKTSDVDKTASCNWFFFNKRRWLNAHLRTTIVISRDYVFSCSLFLFFDFFFTNISYVYFFFIVLDQFKHILQVVNKRNK